MKRFLISKGYYTSPNMNSSLAQNSNINNIPNMIESVNQSSNSVKNVQLSNASSPQNPTNNNQVYNQAYMPQNVNQQPIEPNLNLGKIQPELRSPQFQNYQPAEVQLQPQPQPKQVQKPSAIDDLLDIFDGSSIPLTNVLLPITQQQKSLENDMNNLNLSNISNRSSDSIYNTIKAEDAKKNQPMKPEEKSNSILNFAKSTFC